MSICKNCHGRGWVEAFKMSWVARKGTQSEASRLMPTKRASGPVCPICKGSGEDKDNDSDLID